MRKHATLFKLRVPISQRLLELFERGAGAEGAALHEIREAVARYINAIAQAAGRSARAREIGKFVRAIESGALPVGTETAEALIPLVEYVQLAKFRPEYLRQLGNLISKAKLTKELGNLARLSAGEKIYLTPHFPATYAHYLRRLEESGFPLITLARDMDLPTWLIRGWGGRPLYLPATRDTTPYSIAMGGMADQGVAASWEALQKLMSIGTLFQIWRRRQMGKAVDPAAAEVVELMRSMGAGAGLRDYPFRPHTLVIGGKRYETLPPVIADTGMKGNIPRLLHQTTIGTESGVPTSSILINRYLNTLARMEGMTQPAPHLSDYAHDAIMALERGMVHRPLGGIETGTRSTAGATFPRWRGDEQSHLFQPLNFVHNRWARWFQEKGPAMGIHEFEPTGRRIAQIMGLPWRTPEYPDPTRIRGIIGLDDPAARQEWSEFLRWARKELGARNFDELAGKAMEALGWRTVPTLQASERMARLQLLDDFLQAGALTDSERRQYLAQDPVRLGERLTDLMLRTKEWPAFWFEPPL